ncbi:hypothetical protein ACF9IK_35465 [Kitasatospora hibisci]|uniref:hypothetical protein n=1 Tax=Kitasatospora hibisci TaxID=3369522 RepID=UPI003754485C
MKALTYHGPTRRTRGEVPDPAVPDPAVRGPAVPDPAVPDPAVPDPAVRGPEDAPLLLDVTAAGRLDVAGPVTHRSGLDEMQEAHDVFAGAGANSALKAVLFRT